MDYRMYKPTAAIPAGTNVIDLIKQELKTKGIITHTPFHFIGFNGNPGTEFYLNDSNSSMEIPDSGYFITPYFGERFMPVFNLSFVENFDGKIYYII